MGAGTRSGLYWHIVRLLGEFPARWVVPENVPGLLSSRGGRDMGAVIGSLGDLGYGLAWRVLDAQHSGVPNDAVESSLSDILEPLEHLLGT